MTDWSDNYVTDWFDNVDADGEELEPSPDVVEDELFARVAFHVCGHGVVHEPGHVGELVRDPAIQPVPNAPRTFVGLLNSRGRVVPVFDITRLLVENTGGRSKRSRGIEWVLVFYDQATDSGNETNACVGLVVDDMPLQLRLRPAGEGTPMTAVPELFRPWCQRVYDREGVLYPELDVIEMLEWVRDGEARNLHGDTRGQRVG